MMDTPAHRAGQLIQPDGSVSSAVQWREPLTFGSLPEHQLDLPELLRLLWRQKFVVIGTILLLTAAATVIVFSLSPVYTATATVMLDPREEHVIDIQSVVGGLPPDIETVQTEMEVLRSRDLAARVISALGLERDGEFNPALADTNEPRFVQLVEPLRDGLVAHLIGSSKAPEAGLATDNSLIVDSFLDHLDVAAIGESRAITISFSSGRPTMAAMVANAVADDYLAAQLDTKQLATERANQWLKGQLARLRDQAERSQRGVETFRKESGLLMGDKEMTFPTQEVSQLIEQLVVSQAERATAQADLLQAEAVVAGTAGIDALPQVLDSGLIRSLREQEALLSANLAQLSTQHGKSHPTLLTVAQQLQDIRVRIGAEVNRIVVGLRNRLDAARAREVSLSERLNVLKSRLGDINQAQAELKIREGEGAANQMLFDAFLQRYNQTGLGSTLYEPDARIISHASVPAVPSFPQKKMLVALSLAISGVVGIVLAFLNEARNEGLRSTDELEVLTGASALGLIPVLKQRWGRRQRPETHVLTHRRSAFAESLRNLHTSLALANRGRAPQSILLTSSVPQEGKSTIALSLARLIASTDRRVIVVDADLHRAQMHQIAGLPRQPGLVEVLTGKLPLAEAIRRDPHSPAYLLPAGGEAADTAGLIAGERMAEVMAELRQAHDLVIVDSAPLLAVVDTRLLCRLVDKTVFLVRWKRTRRKTAEAGLRQIHDANGDLGGVLLTCVDVKKYAHYGFGDSGNYHGPLAKYYVR